MTAQILQHNTGRTHGQTGQARNLRCRQSSGVSSSSILPTPCCFLDFQMSCLWRGRLRRASACSLPELDTWPVLRHRPLFSTREWGPIMRRAMRAALPKLSGYPGAQPAPARAAGRFFMSEVG
ncbi:hypothetical protein C8N36_107148 [Pelagimonas varians]|uniref:Uncharacterized protein n=1 Tax=Pelagimonas varians TaxID=696760 RepID=A0A238KCM2_9RHOB|nr:hypothetical protein C8N36_107148 [Pelagimonas varians]SMX40575.1 hypothetical protein PEV8663_02047 [Pelagimonas varians]